MFNSASAVSSSSSSGVSCLDSSRSGSGFSGISSSCCNDSPPPPTTNATTKPTTGAPASPATGVNEIELCECSHSLNNSNGKGSNNNCSNFSQCKNATKGSIITKPSSAAPIRPRHVKAKNQLHKNNSLVSTSSSGGSDSSGSSLQEVEFALGECCNGTTGPKKLMSPGCIDCVTLVSVPDNHVITQGVNHHCTSITNGNNVNGAVAGGLPIVSSSASDNNHNQTHNTNNSDKEQLILDLQSEINQLRRGLANANTTINHLQEREKKFLISATRAHAIENVHHTDNGNGKPIVRHHAPILNSMRDREERRAQWVHEYGALYAQARVETMDALDALPYLANADELKSKLLYSVVVLSFRAVQSHVSEIKRQIQYLLRMIQPTPGSNFNHLKQSQNHLSQNQLIQYNNAVAKNGNAVQKPVNALLLSPLQARVLESINDYMQYSGHMFDLSKCVEQVGHQLWTTLSDYPRLKKCEGLMNYIKACVNLAWGLTNQSPPCVLEYETKVFMREMHVRFHSSDQNAVSVKAYLWPALLEGPNGTCIHKGVVIT